jgi:hypothetical protein
MAQVPWTDHGGIATINSVSRRGENVARLTYIIIFISIEFNLSISNLIGAYVSARQAAENGATIAGNRVPFIDLRLSLRLSSSSSGIFLARRIQWPHQIIVVAAARRIQWPSKIIAVGIRSIRCWWRRWACGACGAWSCGSRNRWNVIGKC